MLAALWGRLTPYLIAAGTMLAAIVAWGAAQRRAGRAAAAAESTETALKDAEVRHDIEDAMRRDGAHAAERLRDGWSRD